MRNESILDPQVFVGGDGLNSVEMQPMTNSVSVSLFDVYTTSYFLSESMTLEEYREVGETAT